VEKGPEQGINCEGQMVMSATKRDFCLGTLAKKEVTGKNEHKKKGGEGKNAAEWGRVAGRAVHCGKGGVWL